MRILAAVLLLALAGGGYFCWEAGSRVERIAFDPADFDRPAAERLRLPGQPPLVLSELRGNTVFLLVEDRKSLAARENRALLRELDMWELPPDVRGFLIVEADQASPLLQRDSRFPLHLDPGGQVRRAFELSEGRTGVVVIGKDGRLVDRHVGPMDPLEIRDLHARLGLRYPPPQPSGRALRGDFEVADLDTGVCMRSHDTCVFVFLSRPITGPNVADPGDPDGRLVAAFAGRALPEGVHGLFVGSLDGIGHARGWRVAGDAPGLRELLGIPAGTTAVVVVEGAIEYDERGFIPAWKYSELEQLIGLPPA